MLRSFLGGATSPGLNRVANISRSRDTANWTGPMSQKWSFVLKNNPFCDSREKVGTEASGDGIEGSFYAGAIRMH